MLVHLFDTDGSDGAGSSTELFCVLDLAGQWKLKKKRRRRKRES